MARIVWAKPGSYIDKTGIAHSRRAGDEDHVAERVARGLIAVGVACRVCGNAPGAVASFIEIEDADDADDDAGEISPDQN